MVVVRLYLGHEYSLSLFGETIGSWMTLVGMVILYTGYSLGMAQVTLNGLGSREGTMKHYFRYFILFENAGLFHYAK